MGDHSESSWLVVHARDPQEQAASFGMLDQSYEQISDGAFSGSLHALGSHDITAFHETLNQSVFQKGMSDPGHVTIAIAYQLSERLYWNSKLLDQGAVVAYAPGREFELRTPLQTACVGVSLLPSALATLAPGGDPADWEKRLAARDCWSGRGPQEALLQARIAALLQGAGGAADPRHRTGELVALRELAIDYLGGVVDRAESAGERLRVDSYPRIARRARAFMLECMDRPLSVTDICLALGCSRRSLQYAFESVFDVSPMAYLRNIRLAQARRRLTSGKPGTTVHAVAAEVGFGHLPRFAQAYARMFGELPSVTLSAHRRN